MHSKFGIPANQLIALDTSVAEPMNERPWRLPARMGIAPEANIRAQVLAHEQDVQWKENMAQF